MFDDLLRPAAEDILAVTDLTRRIKRVLESDFTRVWVRGEVSNLRRQPSGHLYFSLKDDGAQLPCVLFARDAARQGIQITDGMEVLLFGDLSLYEPQGRYQLIAKIALQSGEGPLQLEFERLKRKLAAEGLFDPARKQPLPRLPRRIAVITSPSGAALQDFLRILKRRRFAGELVILPTRVQGKEAPAEIGGMLAHAIASQRFDLIVLTRGGGSIEDLWAFNDEALARAVAACPLPVISAVGHEIDHVLTDYSADRRAETPSGAAELISSLYLEAARELSEAAATLQSSIKSRLDVLGRQHERLAARLQMIAPQRQIELLGMRLDDYENRLSQALASDLRSRRDGLVHMAQRLDAHHPKHQLGLLRQSLQHAQARLASLSKSGLNQKKQSLLHQAHRLKNSSLQSTLQRGYSILEDPEGQILDSVAKAAQAHTIRARLKDGLIELTHQHLPGTPPADQGPKRKTRKT